MLLGCHGIAKAYGSHVLFTDLTLAIADGERWGLIGPNGSGKSTLVRILAGGEEPDRGTRSVRRLASVAYVPQDSVFQPEMTVEQVLERALDGLSMEADERKARVQMMIGRAGFTGGATPAGILSGGQQKRLAIAEAWIRDPDVLLLDEPTNHLDLDGILWLERLLANSPAASLTISHDRYFLENVATHMAEIDPLYPDGIFAVRGNYSEFLEKREAFQEAQARHLESLRTRVKREIEWLRRGPKARTGKSKARIDSAGRLIEELAGASARAATATAQIDFTGSDRQTKRLLVAEGVGKSYAGRRLFGGVDFVLTPGTRLGLVGGNGSGKTTLLKILKGELAPDEGSVRRADLLRMVSFDQNRNERLDPAQTLRKTLCPHGDSVIYRGRPIHVGGWAKRFLFRSEQLDMPVGNLSGGERARVLVAQLMLEEADLLLLDEPTNDLDIPTLEELEESLLDFPGALVLVTHDRYLLDRVSTQVLGLDGQGGHGRFADYSQWEQSRGETRAEAKAGRRIETEPDVQPAAARKKLSYKDQREWDTMEQRILEAEQEQARAQRAVDEAAAAGEPVELHKRYAALQEAHAGVERLYARWAELEALLG